MLDDAHMLYSWVYLKLPIPLPAYSAKKLHTTYSRIWATGALCVAKQGTNTKRWRCKTDNMVENCARYDMVVFFYVFPLVLDESFTIFYIKISQIKCIKNGTLISKFCIKF